MRIDKYLWATRYFKTRSKAADACKGGTVKLNKASVKPAKDVFIGDKISVRKNQITYSFRIIDLPKSRMGAKLVDQYRIDTTPKDVLKHQEEIQASQKYYRNKGLGRPTKKDRRAIEEFLDHNQEGSKDTHEKNNYSR